MILKSYLFCLKQNNYLQYPNDHTAAFLKPLCGLQREKHQVVVYRDGGLMYYCYLYGAKNREIIGLGFATGSLCEELGSLYDSFLSCLDCFAKRGVIFHFGDDGSIRSVADFTQNIGEVEELFRWLKDKTNTTSWVSLPPEDHTIAKGSQVSFNFEEDDQNSIVEATRHYTYVFITMHNPAPTSYSATVKRLSLENNTLLAEKAKLNEEIEHIHKQKKQYELVIALASLMILGALIFIVVVVGKNNKIETQLRTIQSDKKTITSQGSTITSQERIITSQKSTITSQDSTIISQKTKITSQKSIIEEQVAKISTLNEQVVKLESKCGSLETKYSGIASTYPFKITKIEIGNVYKDDRIETDYGYPLYSSRTMYIKPKIYYYGYISGTRQLKVKWYMPTGEMSKGDGSSSEYSIKQSVYIYSGSNILLMNGWGSNTKGNWPSGTYRIEIWYDDICVKSKTFKIY